MRCIKMEYIEYMEYTAFHESFTDVCDSEPIEGLHEH